MKAGSPKTCPASPKPIATIGRSGIRQCAAVSTMSGVMSEPEHITGVSSLVWGNDYPHAEGTFRGSRELVATQFAGVPDDERKAILGGTLASLLGYSPVVAA